MDHAFPSQALLCIAQIVSTIDVFSDRISYDAWSGFRRQLLACCIALLMLTLLGVGGGAVGRR